MQQLRSALLLSADCLRRRRTSRSAGTAARRRMGRDAITRRLASTSTATIPRGASGAALRAMAQDATTRPRANIATVRVTASAFGADRSRPVPAATTVRPASTRSSFWVCGATCRRAAIQRIGSSRWWRSCRRLEMARRPLFQ